MERPLMTGRYVLFLDDGGVISDNDVRAPQWQRMVGQFFAPILGGSAEAWAEANRVVITSFFSPGAWEARMNSTPDYWSFERKYNLDWLADMCQLVGVPTPSEEESVELARRAGAWIVSKVRADFPGAADAIRRLHDAGYILHTASGESSTDLKGYLGATGVLDCFGRLYGPDLVNTHKSGPDYYERIFADAGALPTDALVIDDSHVALSWAVQVGARTVLVTSKQRRSEYSEALPKPCLTVGSLAEVSPELLAGIN
jgi:HAD superfamily hydrolase (TIGR01509 family)